MPSSDPVQRFSDIIENIEAIERFTAEMDLRGFAVADQTIRAAKYSLLVISQAARKLGNLAADLCPLSIGAKSADWGTGCGTITKALMLSASGC